MWLSCYGDRLAGPCDRDTLKPLSIGLENFDCRPEGMRRNLDGFGLLSTTQTPRGPSQSTTTIAWSHILYYTHTLDLHGPNLIWAMFTKAGSVLPFLGLGMFLGYY